MAFIENNKEFEFSSGSSVSMDKSFMHINFGLRKKTIEISNLRHFYLYGGYTQILVLSYADDKGKIKNCSLTAREDDEQWMLLNTEMQKRFPEKSLNNLQNTEAFQQMNMLSPDGTGAVVISIILVIILAVEIVLNWPK